MWQPVGKTPVVWQPVGKNPLLGNPLRKNPLCGNPLAIPMTHGDAGAWRYRGMEVGEGGWGMGGVRWLLVNLSENLGYQTTCW